MSNDVTDEDLCAYIDGHLDGARRTALEAALAQDVKLQARLATLQGADESIRAVFDTPDMAETPDHFRRMIAESGVPGDKVVFFAKKPRPMDWRMAVAASLALAIGVGGGFFAGRGSAPAGGSSTAAIFLSPDSEAPLFALLESTPSAVTQPLDATGTFKPVLTFRASDGRFCREFEVSHQTEAATGVACRTDGEWRVELLVASNARDEAGYAPVSTQHAAIDGALAQLGASAPLSVEEEAALLKRDWKP